MNVLIDDGTMRSIGDSIRGKTGESGGLLPGEMPEAIDGISTGRVKADPEKPVHFYSYDGELLYSYTLEEIGELEALPEVPEIEGLVSQGWNWTKAELIENGREADVGPMYITDDGATRIYISLTEGRLSPILGFQQNKANGVLVDWGDGSEPETYDRYGHYPVCLEHTYAMAGTYRISLLPDLDTTMTIAGLGSLGCFSQLVFWRKGSYSDDAVYISTIRKIELGRNVSIEAYAFASMCSMETITIPEYSRLSGIFAFNNCISLKMLVVPKGDTYLTNHLADGCTNLRHISIPGSIISGNDLALSNCTSLKRIALPKGMTELGNGMLSSCIGLHSFRFPEGVTVIPANFFYNAHTLQEIDLRGTLIEVIGSSAFENCYSIGVIRIPPTVTRIDAYAFRNIRAMDMHAYPETPPAVDNAGFLEGVIDIAGDFAIFIPHGCLEAYNSAVGWRDYAGFMVEMSA